MVYVSVKVDALSESPFIHLDNQNMDLAKKAQNNAQKSLLFVNRSVNI